MGGIQSPQLISVGRWNRQRNNLHIPGFANQTERTNSSDYNEVPEGRFKPVLRSNGVGNETVRASLPYKAEIVREELRR